MATKRPKAPKRKKPKDRRSSKKSLSLHPINNKEKTRNIKHSTNPKIKKKFPAVKEKKERKESRKEKKDETPFFLSTAPVAKQLAFFVDRFQSAAGLKLSPLEMEAFNDKCMVELSQSMDQDVENFGKHMEATFGQSCEEMLCEGKLSEGIVDAGSPALVVISTSALRSLELLRGLRSFTRECRPAKLFAKHMKVEDQVKLLESRVNIASGTPSRIKKLIDMEALSLSRLAVIVLDMHRDAKGYSLFTLQQVSAEFWDLYKSHFHDRLLEGKTRICFYGSIPIHELTIS